MSLFGQFPGLHPPSRSSSKMTQAYHQAVFPPPMANEEQDNDDEEDEDVTVEGAFFGDKNWVQAQMLSKSFAELKHDNEVIKNMVVELQNDRDKLRMAVRKLKVENSRFKAKLKRMSTAIASKRRPTAGGDQAMDADDKGMASDDDLDDNFDFDDIGEFLLIGGPNDPLSIQYRAPVRDATGNEHKTVERYYWYKMAEAFDDKDAMAKILKADLASTAADAAEVIKNFDQKTWDTVKMRHWEDGQRMKFDQYRNLKCLLIKTGKSYLAIASQDKFFGTGWRKQREESVRPHLWDGENRGGRFMMKLRDEYAANHAWSSAQEEQEAQNAFYENRRNVWRRIKRDESTSSRGRGRGRGTGQQGGGRNSNQSHGKSIKNGGGGTPNYMNPWSQPFAPGSFSFGPATAAASLGWMQYQDFPKRRGPSRSGGPGGKRGRY